MLPLQLLRIKVRNKGRNITPIFCTENANDSIETQIASLIIEEFEQAWNKKEKNGVLSERIALLESQYKDYKLVRGFYSLLERRCVFVPGTGLIENDPRIENQEANNNTSIRNRSNTTKSEIDSILPGSTRVIADPFTIRKELFTESSRRGNALTDFDRSEIMRIVASRLGISTCDMAENMWSDLEENTTLYQFYKITPSRLISWYNLSLMQTLLFNCTELEFITSGGKNWKRMLRDVKRLGLMYTLQQKENSEPVQKEMCVPKQEDNHTQNLTSDNAIKGDPKIVCSIDGPMSLFKLTDRYGTAIAKLLPSIVAAETWSLKASIMRNTIDSGKKLYEFEISDKESPSLLREPPREETINRDSKCDNTGSSRTYKLGSNYFDSMVEEKFSRKFEYSANGWKLTREPDTLVLSNGRALIPDFMFEKYGRKVYLEIVGFWTEEYLERKVQKINDVALRQNNKIDFLIAVNHDYYTSPNNFSSNRQKVRNFQIPSLINRNHVILYKNGNIPLKPILDYLKSVEQEMVEKFVTSGYNNILYELEETKTKDKNVISIAEIARRNDIPLEAALRILRAAQEQGCQNIRDIEKTDNWIQDSYLIADTYLISKSKVKELELILERVTVFNEASALLSKSDIPEPCHTDLITKLGFEIVWKGIDSNNTTIKKKTPDALRQL
jgi:predicted nuclease of restriction endonuclease-like RecB superfamily